MYLGSWKIDDYVLIPVDTHRLDTGEVTDADSNPTYKVYEDETASAIVSGTMAKLSDTGHYTDRLQLLSIIFI